MRAIVKASAEQGLTVTDVPEPTPGPNDVLIKVHHAGVCGTDVHIWEWDEWARGRIRPPVVVGHEFAGEIVEIGSNVGGLFQIGQLVTAEGHIVCGQCRRCRTGNGHICTATRIIGVDRDGAFADYLAMPATNVVPLDNIPTTVGSIMDAIGNAFHTVLTAEIPGNSVLIVGCGPIGCFAAGIARSAGATKVIATDVNPFRLELAGKMGAEVQINPQNENVVERVLEETGGEGADVVCEMSGHPRGFVEALKSARRGGRVQLLGIPKEPLTINLSTDVIFKGITIYGVIGRRMYDTWLQMKTFLSSGTFDPMPAVTHFYPLEDIDRAIDVIRAGNAGKVILEIGSN
jgi:threonine 3-dehydrogenase